MTRTPMTALAGVLLAATVLAGCGGGSASSARTAGRAEPAATIVEKGGATGAPGTASGDQAAPPAAALIDRKVIRTADMSVRAKDVAASAQKVRQIAEAANGFVADERTTYTPPTPPAPTPTPQTADPFQRRGYAQSALTLRVPTDSLDRVMEQVAATGTMLSRSQSSEDVSAKYVDTTSRVASQTASVARVRALLARAKNLGDIVQIEGELSRRQADLESLQSQLKALQDQTSLSTLTVTLTPPVVVVGQTNPRRGFVAGLDSGWKAMMGSLTVLLTIVGALLPFVIVLALIGLPVLLLARRLGRRAASGPAGPPAAQPQPTP